MFPYKPCRIEMTRIGPERAKKLLDSCHYDEQRNLVKTHVKALAYEMERNNFKPSTVEVVNCIETGQSYLIDAQHRMHAVIECKLEIDFILIEWEVKTIQEVGILYASTDAGKSRTVRDRIASLIQSVSPDDAARIGSAVLFAENDFHNFSTTEDRALKNSASLRAEKARLYVQEYEAIKTGLNGSGKMVKGGTGIVTRTVLHRMPVLAVFLQTQLFQPERTQKFLRAVAENDRLEKYSAEWNFVNRICPEATSGLNKSEYARRVADIWNHFCKGKTSQRVTARPMNLPFLLEGTPWE